MIDMSQAIRIASKRLPRRKITSVSDCDDAWLVWFGYWLEPGEMPPPGNPAILVDKETGKTDYWHVGRKDFFDRMESMRVVLADGDVALEEFQPKDVDPDEDYYVYGYFEDMRQEERTEEAERALREEYRKIKEEDSTR